LIGFTTQFIVSGVCVLQADAAASESLAALLRAYPLSKRWLPPSLYVDSVRISGVTISLCGLSAGSGNETVTGSAAEVAADPLGRAFFELAERTSVLDVLVDPDRMLDVFDRSKKARGRRSVAELFPEPSCASQRYAKSNGVAAGQTWEEACGTARAELAERDRVLRSWYGEIHPVKAALPEQRYVDALRTDYEWCTYLFPSSSSSPDLTVAGVFAFPFAPTAPLAFGFGAGADLPYALDKAGRECVQRLGFLWGEDLPDSEPPFEPNAEYHQEFYLRPCMHERIRSWLDGAHSRSPCKVDSSGLPAGPPEFIDITPDQLSGRLFVVKALASSELEFVFGRGHPRVSGPLSDRFLIHPLP
jgi:hypothetical protein